MGAALLGLSRCKAWRRRTGFCLRPVVASDTTLEDLREASRVCAAATKSALNAHPLFPLLGTCLVGPAAAAPRVSASRSVIPLLKRAFTCSNLTQGHYHNRWPSTRRRRTDPAHLFGAVAGDRPRLSVGAYSGKTPEARLAAPAPYRGGRREDGGRAGVTGAETNSRKRGAEKLPC